MVRFFKTILLSLLLLPEFAVAQEVSFEAYIDRQNVSSGETFQIKLELINAQAQNAPDLSVMPPEVEVLGQQQQVSSTFINGLQSQNVSWILDVMVKEEGTYKVPAIPVKTNAGELYTKPFRIFVKPASQISSSTSDNSVFIDVQVDKKNPYIDEPVLYKTYIYHINEISNTELVAPKAENAIIEQVTDPKSSRQILNGVNYKMIEVEYLVTPLKTGKIEIEPAVVRGKIARENIAAPRTPMDSLFAPFGGMGIIRTAEYAPFTVASNKIELDVKDVEPGVNPWLVLYDLQIDDELGDVNYEKDSDRITAKEGEPITRKIRMTAYGKSGEALPELEELLSSDDFKIYADKADNRRDFIENIGPASSKIRGTRTQTFTFIPQKSGMLSLPELSISYWSLKDNKVAKVSLPAKVITVLKAGEQTAENVRPEENKPAVKEDKTPAAEKNVPQPLKNIDISQKIENVMNSPQSPNLVILVLSLIICAIMFISFRVLSSARKHREVFDEVLVNPGRKVITETGGAKNIVNLSGGKNEAIDKGFAARIKNAASHAEIQELLQKFSARYLNISQNSGTIIIAQALNRKFGTDRSLAMKYAAELDSVLYAGKNVELDYLRNSFAELIFAAEEKLAASSPENKDDDGLISLNP